MLVASGLGILLLDGGSYCEKVCLSLAAVGGLCENG